MTRLQSSLLAIINTFTCYCMYIFSWEKNTIRGRVGFIFIFNVDNLFMSRLLFPYQYLVIFDVW